MLTRLAASNEAYTSWPHGIEAATEESENFTADTRVFYNAFVKILPTVVFFVRRSDTVGFSPYFFLLFFFQRLFSYIFLSSCDLWVVRSYKNGLLLYVAGSGSFE